MNNNIDQYKKEIEQNKNVMLENYKNLIVAYEDSRQIYEKLLKDYENAGTETDTTPVVCHYISATNYSWTVTKWQVIEAATNKAVYTSGKFSRNEVFGYNLEDIPDIENIWPQQFYLKALVDAGSDSTSSVILELDAHYATCAFYGLHGTAFDTTLTYYGIN